MHRIIFFIVILLFGLALPAQVSAEDCTPGLTTRCKTVTDQEYGGGGYNPTVVPIRACLPERLYQQIKLRDGSAAWEAGFYYRTGQPEVVATVRNSPCWTHNRNGVRQHGSPGSIAIAFVCCDYYCGWVAGVIQSDGTAQLNPVILPRAHDPMAGYRTPATARTGQYDRSGLLN